MRFFRTFQILLLVAATSGCSAFKTEIRTGIAIEAPVERVWLALADFPAYPQWNPYHRQVCVRALELSCDVAQPLSWGTPVYVGVVKPDGERIDLDIEITVFEPGRKLCWGGGISGIFEGQHCFELVPHEGGTYLYHNEDFAGLALPFVPLKPELIEQGYKAMNVALKNRLER